MVDHLGLVGRAQSFDLFDGSGQRASVEVHWGEPFYGNSQHFTFVRQDLLNRYLQETGQAMIWMHWGERMYYDRHPKRASSAKKDREWFRIFSQSSRYNEEKFTE